MAHGPFSGDEPRTSAVSHGVERYDSSDFSEEASGTRRGHLHYKLAVIKPLLTVMGSFQSEVMPATADKPATATAARQAAITQPLPSVTGSSSHAHRKVHFPAQLGTLPRDKCLFTLICYKSRRPEGSTPSQLRLFSKNVSLKPPSEGLASADRMTECLGRHGWVQSGSQVDALSGCEFERV